MQQLRNGKDRRGRKGEIAREKEVEGQHLRSIISSFGLVREGKQEAVVD